MMTNEGFNIQYSIFNRHDCSLGTARWAAGSIHNLRHSGDVRVAIDGSILRTQYSRSIKRVVLNIHSGLDQVGPLLRVSRV